jgi:GAF domain-containing protein
VATVSAQRLAAIFVEVADTLVDDFDLIDFLHLLTDRAASLVDAAAVGIVLADPQGRLEFMAGSSENVKLLELFQLQNQQGPCLEAYRTAEPVINADLGAAGDRWPLFAPRAIALGFGAVHAFPLRLRQQVIGALNVFGATEGEGIHDTDIAVMQALTDVAAIALIQERVIHRSEVLTGQLQGALDSRIIIEQAKGVIAQARGISVDDAFAQIRAYARSHNRRLTDVAQAIVANPAGAQKLP